jgi:hypothetical protein
MCVNCCGEDFGYLTGSQPFTPPPTNQSSFHRWTVGAIYYASLAVAEALGSTNTSQIQDTFANYANPYTPVYTIYENGVPARVAAFNYMDAAGNGSADATLSIVLPSVPSQVTVKYLLAGSVSTKSSTGSITWAGQTFGPTFGSDGRPQGTLNTTTFPCDSGTNTCNITLPAPSFALVFLSDDALKNAGGDTAAPTFATTAATKAVTQTIDPSVLATSNGMNGKLRLGGSTSREKSGAAPGARVSAAVFALLGLVATGVMA